MENKITGDESAFPIIEQTGNAERWDTWPGLTIRQEFAARFTAAIVTATMTPQGLANGTPEDVAEYGLKIADALIAALNTPKTEKPQ